MSGELENTLEKYRETEKQAENSDQIELSAERKRIRPGKESEAKNSLDISDSDKEHRFNRSVDAVSKMIGEKPPHYLTKRRSPNRKNTSGGLRKRKNGNERETINMYNGTLSKMLTIKKGNIGISFTTRGAAFAAPQKMVCFI